LFYSLEVDGVGAAGVEGEGEVFDSEDVDEDPEERV
jgi:hypothetical protein